MRPSQIMRGGGGDVPIGKFNKYLGGFGNFGGSKQKGIITYGISPNRQNPFAGAVHDAFFNTWRRFSGQVLYIAPPFLAAYFIMDWAIHRNEYLNSKAGRAEFADAEE
ncbi:cytochrome b-c1 complex subunit 8 [Lasiosphaeris hirsuta]|uniref:Cytochrome b-c1 complex subunit 8 n=1 Tax=Lasiosphaeris hirsuta TaxID=260670 RepID=A0AA40AS07_9PEZI|nr:cytochrome b-c1 complex subunit 8 [Lasiosphaeris hirsuta]